MIPGLWDTVEVVHYPLSLHDQNEFASASELFESPGSEGEHGRLIDDASLSTPASSSHSTGSFEFEQCDLDPDRPRLPSLG